MIKIKERKYYKYFEQESWSKAEKIIDEWLIAEPQSTWLMGQKSSILCEKRKYKKALIWSNKAIQLEPWEPLILWIHAGNLEMNGFETEAFNIWSRLARTSSKILGEEDCGEGKAWAESLKLDSLYRMVYILKKEDAKSEAKRYVSRIKRALKNNVESIYSADKIQEVITWSES